MKKNNDIEELKLESKKTWGNSPAGTTNAPDLIPGTKDFFLTALKKRSEYEIPWLLDFFNFSSTKGKKVLEVGYGVGFDAYEFLRAGAIYKGIDLTPQNLERATMHMSFFNLQGNFLEADVEALEDEKEVYDIVFSNGVLHHTPNIDEALRRLNNCLKKNGELWITVYNKNSIFFWFHLFLGEWILRGQFLKMSLNDRVSKIEFNSLDTTPLVVLYTPKSIKKLLEQNGFEIKDIAVRKLNSEDFPTLRPLRLMFEVLPKKVIEYLGRHFGWYICVKAYKKSI